MQTVNNAAGVVRECPAGAESTAELVQMAALFSAPPHEDALSTPRFAFQHSMIPRPASSKKIADAESSPKSVITDMRFMSPGSSSSSSKCQSRGLERSYSTSDGEFSDPDSVGTSRELGKVLCFFRVPGTNRKGFSTVWPCLRFKELANKSHGPSLFVCIAVHQSGNSGPLESLPETHSLALEATNAIAPAAMEMSKTLTTSLKRGGGEPTCRIPLFPAVNGQ